MPWRYGDPIMCDLPGDPSLPPAASINCRCAVAHVVNGLWQTSYFATLHWRAIVVQKFCENRGAEMPTDMQYKKPFHSSAKAKSLIRDGMIEGYAARL